MEGKRLEEIKGRQSASYGYLSSWAEDYSRDVKDLLTEVERLTRCNDNQLKVIKNQEDRLVAFVEQTRTYRKAVGTFLNFKDGTSEIDKRLELANAFDVEIDEEHVEEPTVIICPPFQPVKTIKVQYKHVGELKPTAFFCKPSQVEDMKKLAGINYDDQGDALDRDREVDDE